MLVAFNIVAVLLLPAAGIALLRAKPAVQGTTLTIAWTWAACAWLLLSLAVLSEILVPRTAQTGPLLDMLWYSAALVGLAVSIAVLGARRPGVSAWSWFVLFPLLFVFGWPMLTAWDFQWSVRPWQLETPQLLGFVLVLLMGVGNYAGTRHWASACMYALATCMLVAPVSSLSPAWLAPALTRMIGACLMSLAIVSAALRVRSDPHPLPSPNRVWTDFRNSFGIVWARGLQDRFNRYALQERWPVQLESSKFVWDTAASSDSKASIEIQLEKALHWMLRRFVSAEWINQRLHPLPENQNARRHN